MSRKPTARLTDEQMWVIVNAALDAPHRQIAESIGAEYFTVAAARRRIRNNGWTIPVRYAPCGYCGRMATSRSPNPNQAVYHRECKPEVINQYSWEQRQKPNTPKSTEYVRRWRQKNPLRARQLRDRERDARRRRRTDFLRDKQVERLREYDWYAQDRTAWKAMNNNARWSDEDNQYLLDHIDESAESIAKQLKRSMQAVRTRKKDLRRRYGLEVYWPTDYVIPLREAAQQLNISQQLLIDKLGARPVPGMVSFAEIEAIKTEQPRIAKIRTNYDQSPLTDAECWEIVNAPDSISSAELARRMNRPYNTVRVARKRFAQKGWTVPVRKAPKAPSRESIEKKLRSNREWRARHAEKVNADSAEKRKKNQDRSLRSASRHREFWTPEEDAYLRDNPNMPIIELALTIRRSYDAIVTRRRILRRQESDLRPAHRPGKEEMMS